MFVDASAFVAVLMQEQWCEPFEQALLSAENVAITEFALMETGLAVMRHLGRSAIETDRTIREALALFDMVVAPLTASMILTALQAHERYGKGRKHPAQLNMGDCLSYAAARTLGLPLLYKGEDFACTDIPSALA